MFSAVSSSSDAPVVRAPVIPKESVETVDSAATCGAPGTHVAVLPVEPVAPLVGGAVVPSVEKVGAVLPSAEKVEVFVGQGKQVARVRRGQSPNKIGRRWTTWQSPWASSYTLPFPGGVFPDQARFGRVAACRDAAAPRRDRGLWR